LGDREGNPLIRATVKQFARAQRASGTPSQFCWSSSTVGAKSFGIPDKPSRFCEIERSGAVQRYDDAWWIDEIGIRVAGKTYAERKADLVNPEFYVFADPVHSDSRNRMRLRRLAHEPTSCLIAVSVPPIALKNASVVITRVGDTSPYWRQTPPAKRAKLYIDVPPRWHYTVTADFHGASKQKVIFAELPLAERAEFTV
jgi:hypothetical protein